MAKKYEVTNDILRDGNRVLYRIRALKDFNDVKAGDLGGYVASVKTLSQEGDCWIYDDACACDYSYVCDNATLRGNAVIKHRASIHHNAQLQDDVIVGGDAYVLGDSCLTGKLRIYDDAYIEETSDCLHIDGFVNDFNITIYRYRNLDLGVVFNNLHFRYMDDWIKFMSEHQQDFPWWDDVKSHVLDRINNHFD